MLQEENSKYVNLKWFKKAYRKFLNIYSNWVKEANVEHALKSENPWQQFREKRPETLQRQKDEIVEPKKFYKQNRKYVPYAPRV